MRAHMIFGACVSVCVDCVRWTVRVVQLRIDASIIHLVRKSIPLIGRALKSIKGFVLGCEASSGSKWYE